MWGTMDSKSELLVEPRVQYQGEETISQVTGRPEPSYPDWKRNLFRFLTLLRRRLRLGTSCRYFVTAPVIFISLLTVVLTGFLILEFQVCDGLTLIFAEELD